MQDARDICIALVFFSAIAIAAVLYCLLVLPYSCPLALWSLVGSFSVFWDLFLFVHLLVGHILASSGLSLLGIIVLSTDD